MEKVNKLDLNIIKSKHAIASDIDGTLNVFPSDKCKGGIRWGDIVLEDVEINILANGNMHLTGTKRNYTYSDYSQDYEEVKKLDKYVLKDERIKQPKFFGLFPIGSLVYTSGWMEHKERENYEAVTSNYRITGI